MPKSRLRARLVAIFLSLTLALAAVPAMPTAAHAASDYYPADVAVINGLIANNGLDWRPAQEDGSDPGWSFVSWSSGTPRRIEGIEIYEMFSSEIYGTVDLRALTNLRRFYCFNNNVSALEVSGLTNLEELYCASNNISSLNLANLPSLKKLDCTKNNISVLDVSSLTNLEELSCGWNPNISSLDVSSLTNLKSLSCWRLGISSLDVSSLRNLEALYCDENSKITSLDVSGLTKLRDLFCRDNNISSLDLTGLANLQDLRCENNNMSTLKLSAMPGLWYFSCFNNNISTLDVSGLTNLSSLHCQNNNISTLDVSGLTNLSSLHCQNNKLSALYLPSVTLMSIYCYGNRLTSLDLSAIPQITFRNTSAQTPTINKIGNGTSYTNNVFMDPATVFDSSAITYSNGMLISTDKTVASTTFTSPTGYSGIDLSGTITFVYKETLDGRVAITGTAKSGETLKADTSGLKTTPVSDLGDISYQWYRGGVAIPSASAQTYKVVDADVGKAITVTVSTANCVGSVTSLAVTPIAADNNNIKPGGGGTGGGAGSGGAGSDVTGGSTSGGGAGTGSGMGDGNSSGSGGSGSNASSDNTSPTNPQAIPAAGDPIDNNSRQTIWLLSAAGFTCLVAAARIRRREQH